ncbi:hypothetical protein A9798_10795 [Edwardsiella hoshinae]|uniref:Uncharacterized protein n=1 Tax=Edwardsiella hoshinae TaxID=93378 RepID=A0ABM6EK03_9GAMM|nr:hypothetical protein A9798_10795 [Edwardsiella hoshinae]
MLMVYSDGGKAYGVFFLCAVPPGKIASMLLNHFGKNRESGKMNRWAAVLHSDETERSDYETV